MNELKQLLLSVSDSYYDFVVAMMNFAAKSEDRRLQLTQFLLSHPAGRASDVIKYVSMEMDLLSDHISDVSTQMLAVS